MEVMPMFPANLRKLKVKSDMLLSRGQIRCNKASLSKVAILEDIKVVGKQDVLTSLSDILTQKLWALVIKKTSKKNFQTQWC